MLESFVRLLSEHCYAERIALRKLQKYENGSPWTKQNASMNVVLHSNRLEIPLRAKRPRMYFVNSMSDLFHEQIPDEFIDRVFATVALSSQHTFQILTKRAERMRDYISAARERVAAALVAMDRPDIAIYVNSGIDLGDGATPHWPLRCVWLGVSVEDQRRADERIPFLLKTPAAVRFVSAEPLLGPINFGWTEVGSAKGGVPILGMLDWVIVGGESGHGARPMHPDWARSIRDECVEASVPFFFKQWGEHVDLCQAPEETARRVDARENLAGHPDADKLWRVGKKAAGRELDGRTWDEMPRIDRESR